MRRLLSVVLIAIMFVGSLPAGISLDGSIQGPAGGTGCGAASNCPTWTQTFSGSATHAVFLVSAFNTPGTHISAITIGGVLTCSIAEANDGTHFATAWVAICPLTFTGSQTVAITLNTTPSGGWIAYCQSVISGATGTYIDGGTSATSVVSAATATSTTSNTTTTNNNWAFSVFTVSSAATSIAAGSGETQLGSTITGIGGDKWFAVYKPNNSSGTVSTTTTWSGGTGFAAKAQLVLIAASTPTNAARRRFYGTAWQPLTMWDSFYKLMTRTA